MCRRLQYSICDLPASFTAISTPGFKNETVWNYEAGMKARLGGGRGSMTLAAFYADIKQRTAALGRDGLDTAIRLMQGGATPSVSEVAEAAGVSRATAYRYFPSQASLVQAVVHEALGPILTWQSSSPDAGRRVGELIDTALPRIDAFEATFKAALKLSLEQGAR